MTRPKIICHMFSAVDGRLDTERFTSPFDGKARQEIGRQYWAAMGNFGAQARIVGRTTVQKEVWPKNFESASRNPAASLEPHVGPRESKLLQIILDPSGKIAYDANTLMGDNLVAVLGEGVSEEYLKFLRNLGISYVFAGKDGRDIAKALDTIRSVFGVETALLVGGGTVNGAFLKAGVIDELSLMIYPGIDGLNGAACIFEAPGEAGELPSAGQSLEFQSVEILNDGLLWARYKFHHAQ